MSQHRKLTLEKKILPPLLQGFEPATFRSRVRRSNHRARPTQWFIDFEYKIPVNMPDPIRKGFGYGRLWPLRPAYSQNRAGSYTPDPTSGIPFQFRFSKEGLGHSVQNRPGSDVEGLARVWLNSSGLKASWCAESSGPVSARRKRPATSFPLTFFRIVCVFHSYP